MPVQFKHLFAPLKIGSITVRNRLLITGHSTNYCDSDSLFTERDAYYLAERAKGGVGLIITGCVSVHPTSAARRLYPIGYTKETVPRYRLIADMVHEHGGRVLCQIRHHGHLTDSNVFDDCRQVWAPSPIAASGVREIPKEMEKEDIREVVEAFGICAAYIREGGIDGVELHAASGYLLQQFMSPTVNKRIDEYGGSLDNRLRITLEIIDRIRETCGRDFVMGIRFPADELVPGGFTLEDAKLIAQKLESTGKLDFLDVVAGSANASYAMTAPMDFRQGFLVPLAAGIKQAVKQIPVFTVGRITNPAYAEKVLADGHADMVGMTRAFISDPELGNKAREGRLRDIRSCVGCNQGCRARTGLQRPMTCIQNVGVGREKSLGTGTVRRADFPKLVMVVGGGPAGMETARVAALRGHRVLLYEQANRLGGQINLAAKPRSRREFGVVARNLIRFLEKLDVTVRLGVEVRPEMVKEIDPDVVVLATGSLPCKTGFSAMRPDLQGIPGAEQENVVTVFDVLQGTVELGDHVVLVDDEGHLRASGTAEFIADQGKKVEILTRFPSIGFELEGTHDQRMYYQKLTARGVVFRPYTAVEEIVGRTVIAYTTYSKTERRIEGVDHVVLAMGNRVNHDLYKALKGKVNELYAVGDCVHPRKVADAIYEGHVTGRKI